MQADKDYKGSKQLSLSWVSAVNELGKTFNHSTLVLEEGIAEFNAK